MRTRLEKIIDVLFWLLERCFEIIFFPSKNISPEILFGRNPSLGLIFFNRNQNVDNSATKNRNLKPKISRISNDFCPRRRRENGKNWPSRPRECGKQINNNFSLFTVSCVHKNHVTSSLLIKQHEHHILHSR